MPTARVNDIDIYYEVHGQGDPLLLVCGLGSDVSMFSSLIEPLSSHWQVIAFDNRGAGRTDKPDHPYSIEMMAADAAGLLTALGAAPAHVLGVSMGGRIALELALGYPERVRSLMLVCTSAQRRDTFRLPWGLRLLLVLQWLPLLRGRYPQPRYAHMHQRWASMAYDATGRLGEIRVPTLVLHGRKDRVAPFAQGAALQAGIPAARLVPFRGGHLFFLIGERQPFLEALMAFLDDLAAPDAGARVHPAP